MSDTEITIQKFIELLEVNLRGNISELSAALGNIASVVSRNSISPASQCSIESLFQRHLEGNVALYDLGVTQKGTLESYEVIK